MSKNKRNTEREWAFARVIVHGIPGQIRDINHGGIKIALLEPLTVSDNEEISLMILPEEVLPLSNFSIKGLVKWTKADPFGQMLGLEIVSFPDRETRESYEKLHSFYQKRE